MHQKLCREHKHTEADRYIASDIKQELLMVWYDKIRVEDWWNRTQVIKQDVSRYNRAMIINRKSDVKSDESIQRIRSWHLLLYYSSYPDV